MSRLSDVEDGLLSRIEGRILVSGKVALLGNCAQIGIAQGDRDATEFAIGILVSGPISQREVMRSELLGLCEFAAKVVAIEEQAAAGLTREQGEVDVAGERTVVADGE